MTIDPDRVREVFLDVCEIDEPDRRAARLHELCGDDAELLGAVEALLRCDRPEERFLSGEWRRAADALEIPAPQDGLSAAAMVASRERIGPFTIIDILGEGGMGFVCRAEQEHPRRIVALKMLRHGVASPRLRRRFELEAEALARLQHPGIAQIYEIGVAETGAGTVPYIAMELVGGRPLLEHTAAEGLDVRARLELFARVCDAVQHAHGRGVIHRDLKPSNIVVEAAGSAGDGIGQPRVLDFGIARLVDRATADTGTLTMPGFVVGTLAAMSPEQLASNADDIDTRSDIYSLGVLLYELLAGRPPHDLTTCGMLEAARIVRDETPPRLGAVRPELGGDLEVIVAKAMEKDRNRRYASAAALADDVRRYLRSETVLARPPSAVYAVRKFIRRRRYGVLATGLVVLFGLGAITLALAHARARDREDLALERAALALARADAAAAREQAAIEIADARTESLLGFIDSILQHSRTGNRSLASIPLGAVIDTISAGLLARTVAPEHPLKEARFHETLGKRFHLEGGMPGIGERHLARAIELYSSVESADRFMIANTRRMRGEALVALGRFDEAIDELAAVVDHCRKDPTVDHAAIVQVLLLLGNTQSRASRHADAMATMTEAIALLRSIEPPQLGFIVYSSTTLADVQRRAKRFDEAEATLKDALAACEGNEAAVGALSFIKTLRALGRLARDRQRWEECSQYQLRALDAARLYPGPANVEMFNAQRELAIAARDRGDSAEAERWFRGAIESCRAANEYRPQNEVEALRELAALLDAQPDRSEDAARMHAELARAIAVVEGKASVEVPGQAGVRDTSVTPAMPSTRDPGK